MGLKDELLRGVYAYGFERPSAVQQRAVKPITSGRDVIAQSQVRRLPPRTTYIDDINVLVVPSNAWGLATTCRDGCCSIVGEVREVVSLPV